MAAYGLGGLFSGFAQGMRLAGEEEDRAQRKKLQDLQMESTQLEINKKQREAQYESERSALYDSISRESQGGVSGEVVDEFGVNLGRQTYFGANRPDAGLQFAGEAKQIAPRNALTDPGFAEDVISRQQHLDLKYGKINLQDAMKGMQTYNTLLKEGAFDAGNYFLSTGDSAGAMERFNAKGGLRFPEGATIEPTDAQLFPGVEGSPMQKSFVIKDKDGKVLADWAQIRRSALNPKDVLANDTDTGKAVLEFTFKNKQLGETVRHNQAVEELRKADSENQKLYYKKAIEEMGIRRELTLEQIGATRDARRATALQNVFTQGQRNIFQQTGFNPMKGDALAVLPPAEKEDHFNKLQLAGVATHLYEANVNLEKLTPNLTPSESVMLAKRLEEAGRSKSAWEDFSKGLKRDDMGTFVMLNGKKAYVPEPRVREEPQEPGKPARRSSSQPAATPSGGLGSGTGGILGARQDQQTSELEAKRRKEEAEEAERRRMRAAGIALPGDVTNYAAP